MVKVVTFILNFFGGGKRYWLYIPIGQVHSLENPRVMPLEMIEVQSGSYLGEDDIVRFEGKCGRV